MLTKEKLKAGEVLIGSWITLAHPAIAEIMCQAGFDWVTIDIEHSVISLREVEELIRIAHLSNVAPLVRLTSNDPHQIKRVMDAGAHGIIVPMVNTEEQAIQAVESVYYPPRGKRGVGLARAQGYGASFKEYKNWVNEQHPIIIVQIEHIDAVNNIEKILSVPGVDGYIIGPYDLSASMGISGEFDRPELVSAIEKIKVTAKKMNKPGGVHIVEPDPIALKTRIQEGFTFIAYSVDIRMLDVSARAGLMAIRRK